MICGGVLAGLVSVTSICHNISLGSACVVGFIGSFLYTQLQKVFERREIDDPLHSSSIHGICGGWSLIAAGLFDPDTGLLFVGNADQLMIQAIGLLSYATWAFLLSYIFFRALKENDRLRIPPLYEILGLSWLSIIDL